MAASRENLYKAHVKNLRAVEVSFERIMRELNDSLSRGDEKTADALTKTTMLLLGAWAENRLRKLTFEPNGFSGDERNMVGAAPSQIYSWKKAIELGFRKRYGISQADLNTTLPITARPHYQNLLATLDDSLKPIIEVRNKLAHGQWSRTLNSANDDFSGEMMARISAENAPTVKFKKRLLNCLAQLIHDLVAGNSAFERDLDMHFSNLEQAKRDIENRSYQSWLASMRAKYQRGRAARTSQSSQESNPPGNKLLLFCMRACKRLKL